MGQMLFSPKLWRKIIKPYAMRVVQHARSRGMPVNLHSDGYIMQIVDDIIEMGYTSWHPVQESAGMDPREIKAKYGDKIVIYGSLDVVDGLLKYDGDELDEYITERFGIYAPGGGFIFNGGHFIQPDIPIYGDAGRMNDNYTRDLEENLDAVLDAVVDSGFVDRDKMGIGGHSYGAVSTVNAMTLMPNFKACPLYTSPSPRD